MKKLAVVLIAIAGLLSACIVEPVRDGRYDQRDGREYRGERDRDRDGVPNRVDRDRDNDGVPNRADRAPADPRRY